MHRQFIAVLTTPGTSTSGFKNNRADAEQWAVEQLAVQPKTSKVMICESIATVERDVPPIRTTELNGYDGDYNTAKKLAAV